MVLEFLFMDFKKEELLVAFKNLRDTAPIPARSTTRLLVASIAYHYYVDTAREVNESNMHFTNVLREFNIEWKAIVSLKDQDNDLKLPMLSKNTPPLKWCESFKHYLANTFGVRNIPLSYVVREKVEVDPEVAAGGVLNPDITYDPLQPNKSYGSSGSVLEDLISRSGHDHALYKTDNATVYILIEQAARSSSYSSTIKPFETRQDC